MDDIELFAEIEKIQNDLHKALDVVILIENDISSREPEDIIYGAACLVHEKLKTVYDDISFLFERLK